MHSVYCKQNPQQAKIRFVAESATLLLFFDILCCFGLQKVGEFAESTTVFAESRTVCENHK